MSFIKVYLSNIPKQTDRPLMTAGDKNCRYSARLGLSGSLETAYAVEYSIVPIGSYLRKLNGSTPRLHAAIDPKQSQSISHT